MRIQYIHIRWHMWFYENVEHSTFELDRLVMPGILWLQGCFHCVAKVIKNNIWLGRKDWRLALGHDVNDSLALCRSEKDFVGI